MPRRNRAQVDVVAHSLLRYGGVPSIAYRVRFPAVVRSAACLIFVQALCACGGSARPLAKPAGDRDWEKYDGQRVVKVQVAGNLAIDDEVIIDGLSTHDPIGLVFPRYARFDAIDADVDRERIEALYSRHGYFSARVTAVDVEPVSRGVAVRFHVLEGEPSRIREVIVSGPEQPVAISPAQKRILGRLDPGGVLDYDAYEAVKIELLREFVERGHAYARVKGYIDVNREQAAAAVAFELDPGPVVRLGNIRLIGADGVPASFLLNRVDWRPGDVYDPRELERTRARLFRLGWFRDVRISLAGEGRPEVADVILRVDEQLRHELKLGVGAAMDDIRWEVHARAGYRKRAFLDPLLVLDVDVRPAYTFVRSAAAETRGFGGEASVDLSREDLFVPLLKGRARVAYRSIVLESYSRRGPRARVNLGRTWFSESLLLSAGWEIESLQFFDVHEAITEEVAESIGLTSPYRLGRFEQLVAVDVRDNLLDPHRGAFAQLQVEEGGGFAGGKYGYVRASADVRGYVSPWSRLVLAGRVFFARALSGSLPVTRRLYGGGASSHRGFAQRQLSPFVTAEDGGYAPIGGEALLEGSMELRYHAFRIKGQWLGFAVFFDGGDAVLDASDIELDHLHWATGGGLRYNTLVGPIRFDVGYRLNRKGPGEPRAGDSWAFHISLGEAF